MQIHGTKGQLKCDEHVDMYVFVLTINQTTQSFFPFSFISLFLNCCQYLRYMIYLKHMQCLAIRYDVFEFFGNNIAVFISTYINCLMEHIFRFYLPSDGFLMLFNVYVGLLVESMRIEIGLVLRS